MGVTVRNFGSSVPLFLRDAGDGVNVFLMRYRIAAGDVTMGAKEVLLLPE